MYHTCLYCTNDLGTNEVLETLPIGRRVAFDAAQGRLWVVCRACAKWNLVPFDTRLETIDACERIFRDTQTRYSTDNIGLARVRDGLDLIRIGAPQRPEFASWRYGEQYRRRRRRAMAGSGVGFSAPLILSQFMHAFSIGSVAAGFGAAALAQALPAAAEYMFARRQRLRVITPAGGSLALYEAQLSTASLGWREFELTLTLRTALTRRKSNNCEEWVGPDARLLTRRVLARLNRKLGSRQELTDAVTLLGQQSGKLDAWLYWLSQATRRRKETNSGPEVGSSAATGPRPNPERGTLPISTMTTANRLAIEMWLSEEDEAKALAGELSLLERQWQEAEELAAIADSLAVSDEVHDRVPARK